MKGDAMSSHRLGVEAVLIGAGSCGALAYGSVRIRKAIGLRRALACDGHCLMSLTLHAGPRTRRPSGPGTSGADQTISFMR